MPSRDNEHRETGFITGACRLARVVAAGAVSDSAGSSSILYSCLRSPLAPPCQAFCTACSVPVAINYAGTEMTRHHQRDPRLEQGPAPPLWKPWWQPPKALWQGTDHLSNVVQKRHQEAGSGVSITTRKGVSVVSTRGNNNTLSQYPFACSKVPISYRTRMSTNKKPIHTHCPVRSTWKLVKFHCSALPAPCYMQAQDW